MFIDESYFVKPLVIAQLGEKAVIDGLKDIINRYEPKIMEAALGYDFLQAFITGLTVDPIEHRWSDLLNGVAFTNVSGIKRKWVGWAGGPNTQVIIAAQRPDLFIYAGITSGFPAGGYTYTNTTLKGWNFTLEAFGAGTLEPGVEWNPTPTGGIVLTDSMYETQYNERWVIHFTGKQSQGFQSGGQNFLSPIAGFIYYEYFKDLCNQATGVGIVVSEAENSVIVTPIKKMCAAYNNACRDIWILWEFLQADKQLATPVYPEFNIQQVPGYQGGYWMGFRNSVSEELYSFRPVNSFGI